MCRLRKESRTKTVSRKAVRNIIYEYDGYIIKIYPAHKSVEIYDMSLLVSKFRIETLSRYNSAYKALVKAMIDRSIQIYEEGENDSGT